MSNLHLVTGYAGKEHITAADQGAFHSAFLGTDQFVFSKGNQLAASIVTNNQVRILDGDISMQGRYIRLNEGTYVDLTIENGVQDYKRKDLIVARYTKDTMTGVEEANLVVIKGTAVASDPVDPDYTVGDLLENHDILNDMLLYRVTLDGINIQTVEPLFAVKSMDGLFDKQDRTNSLRDYADLADDDMFPYYDVSTSIHRKVIWSKVKEVLGKVFAPLKHTHATSEVTNLDNALNAKAVTATYTATVTATWTASGSHYYQDIAVNGILESDNPIVGVNYGSDEEANVLYDESICKVIHITTSANSIRVWATEAVETAFPIQLKVVR